jgi:transcriptional regulator with PAS, ATPase and Fis domain
MSEITNVIREVEGKRQLHLRRLRLHVVEGSDKGLTAQLENDVVRIGTKEGNHLRLTDDTVSRNHAEIVRDPTGILLRDLGSTNGTFVGPVRVKEVYLGEQRRFRVGRTEIEFTPQDEVIDIVPTTATRFQGLVGRSVSMREVFSVLERIARTELTVLVTGETGTGKELVSRAIHQASNRRNGPFVVFDCGAVARNLVESELFGHEKGAFTGAVAPRAGVFEQAHGGTIFIDELGELPIELQPALLRVLEQREVRRVGDRKVRPVDVRVVAATNRDLQQLVAEGQFRQDLYYRLAVVEVALPPLRERREDFGLIVSTILETAPFEHHVKGLTSEVERVFQAWHWPGNIRELRNVLLRAIPFCNGEYVDLDALPEALRGSAEIQVDDDQMTEEVQLSPTGELVIPTAELSFKEAKDQLMESFERYYLEDLLQRAEGNLSKAARLAGVDRKTIARMLKRHDVK